MTLQDYSYKRKQSYYDDNEIDFMDQGVFEDRRWWMIVINVLILLLIVGFFSFVLYCLGHLLWYIYKPEPTLIAWFTGK